VAVEGGEGCSRRANVFLALGEAVSHAEEVEDEGEDDEDEDEEGGGREGEEPRWALAAGTPLSLSQLDSIQLNIGLT